MSASLIKLNFEEFLEKILDRNFEENIGQKLLTHRG
jgi:hypothetical protein